MENHIIRNGIYYGVIAIVLTLALYFIDHEIMMSYSSWAIYLIGIWFMVMAVQAYRNEQEGYITLGDAFTKSWLVYVIGISISGIFSFVLYNYIDVSLLDTMRQVQMDAIDKMAGTFGMDQEAVDRAKAGLEGKNPLDLKAMLIALPISFMFPGALFAIVIAAIMKRTPLYN
jgi:phosphatidylglycerophosphate synthase